MTPFELRPLAIGELLDRVFTLYRRHLATFAGIMAVPSLFNLALALSILTVQHVSGPMFPANPRFGDPRLLRTIFTGIGVYLLVIVAYWIAYMLALGAATLAVSEIYGGREITIGGAFGRARRHIGRLMLLGLLWFLLIVVPGVLLASIGIGVAVAGAAAGGNRPEMLVLAVMVMIAGGLVFLGAFIYLSLRYSVSAPALVLEQVSATAALRRSTFLTRGYLGRVFLVALCAAMLTYTAVMLFQMPFSVASAFAGKTSTVAFWLDMIGAVCGTIGQTLAAPIMVIGVAVLYYDLRVRKEALDLQVMMNALDNPGGGGLPMTTPPSPALPH